MYIKTCGLEHENNREVNVMSKETRTPPQGVIAFHTIEQYRNHINQREGKFLARQEIGLSIVKKSSYGNEEYYSTAAVDNWIKFSKAPDNLSADQLSKGLTAVFAERFMNENDKDYIKASLAFAKDLHRWLNENGYPLESNGLSRYLHDNAIKTQDGKTTEAVGRKVYICDFVYDFCDVVIRRTKCIVKGIPFQEDSQSSARGFLSIDVLRDICRCVPASSLPGYGKSCELRDLYVPTRLCTPKVVDRTFCQLPEVIRELDTVSLDEAIENSKSMFLLGKSGSGKTIALHSVAMRKCEKDKQDAEAFPMIPKLRDKHIFVMQCGDINDSFSGIPEKRRFERYIEESIRRIRYTGEDGQVSGVEPDPYECHRYYKNVMQDAEAGKLLLLIDGLDHLNCEVSSRGGDNARKLFFDALKGFIDAHPGVQYILTAAPDTYCGDKSLYEYSREMSAQVYMLAPFSDDDVVLFCRKWSKLTGRTDEFAETSARTINTSELRGLLELPMLLSCFLSTVSADRTNISMSELMLISATVDIATRNFIAVEHDEPVDGLERQGSRLIYKYDVKIPLAYIALSMTKHNYEKIPLYRSRRGEYLCSAEDILFPKGVLNGIAPAMDPYLTDQSYVRRGMLAQFFRQLSEGENKYPFINITKQYVTAEEGSVECEFLSFSSPIFQNYFCSYAIGKGCRTESVKELIAGDKGLASFCRFTEPRDESKFRRRVRIIADAAIISRIGAAEYVDVLVELASSTYVYRRRYRELAVFTLVRILGRSPILPEEKWKEAVDAALEYSLYHEQLDDIRRILRSAPRKQTFFNHIYTRFYNSVLNQYPIPSFNWLMGYIALNWMPLTQSLASLQANYDQFHSDEIFEEISHRLESGVPVDNNINVLCERINEAIYGKVEAPLLMMLVSAFCSHFWMAARDTVIAESLHRQRMSRIGTCDSNDAVSASDTISEEQVKLLLSLLSYIGDSHADTQRLVNQVCYSLVHCRAIQKNGKLQVVAPMDNLSVLLHDNYLENIVSADYHGRLAKRKNGHNCLCGGVRAMTVIDITRSDYGRCADDARRQLYHEIWLKNGGVDNNGVQQGFSHDEDERGDNTRKLMLIFKLCYLSGAYGDTDADAIMPIKQLLMLKYPEIPGCDTFHPESPEYDSIYSVCFGNPARIGLEYDLEDDFGVALRRLYDEYR